MCDELNILCTDKTGTLTQDRIILEMHLDYLDRDSSEVLHLTFLNSFYQTGQKSLLDVAVLNHLEISTALEIENCFIKIDETPLIFRDG